MKIEKKKDRRNLTSEKSSTNHTKTDFYDFQKQTNKNLQQFRKFLLIQWWEIFWKKV